MIRILIKSFILYFLLTTFLFSETISQIEVNGNKRISEESVVVFSELKTGMNFNDSIINDSLKKLYKTNFFESVDISYDNSKIRIYVIENPIVEKIEIIGIKKKTFLEFIEENIYLSERVSFNDFYLQNDLNVIKNILKTNGYYFSDIKTSFNKNSELNTINLKIEINLGEKAKIENISFIGNKVFKDKKLLEVIASEENKFWKFISNNIYLNRSRINLDKRLLQNYYKNRGFYNVKILDNYIDLDVKKSSFNLIYNIDAGEEFTINKLSLILPQDYSEDDFTKIYKTFDKNLNITYSLEFIDEILEEIENIASNRSYDFIDVKVEEEISDNNKLNFNFIISDSKKFYIERVNFLGNYTTIEEVLRNKLIIDEGDPLNNLLYNKSVNNIRSLGFFKNVNCLWFAGESLSKKT